MRKALLCLASAMLLASGCHRGSGESLQRQQQQYDTVQEGRTSTAVTSTITAPGEAASPAAGMTATNADTTTNFTLPQVSSATGTQSQPGTIAGTMTVPSNSGPLIGYPSNPPTRAKPRPAVTKMEPPKNETPTTTDAVPPAKTDTTPPTTDTAPPPPPETDTQPPPTTTTGLGPQASGLGPDHP